MIVAVRAVSHAELFNTLVARARGLDRSGYPNAWSVLVADPGSFVLSPMRAPTLLSLEFDDIDPDDMPPLIGEAKRELVPCTLDQVREIVAFVRESHARRSRDLLLVSCHAGVSRSGAIGFWAACACGIDPDAFRAMNPQIQPNPHVLRLLDQADCEGKP